MAATFIKRVRYHQDPGHGWLEVPRADVLAFGLAGKVSRYSYERGQTVFLEEDSDAPLFIAACAERGITVLPIDVHSDRESFIRWLPAFSA